MDKTLESEMNAELNLFPCGAMCKAPRASIGVRPLPAFARKVQLSSS